MGTKTKKTWTPTSRYGEWVDSLGLERSWLGHFLSEMERRFRLRRVALVFGFSLVLSYMLLAHWQMGYRLNVGDMVRTRIVSPTAFEFVDDELTAQRRDAAAQSVPPVYDIDFDIYEKKVERLTHAFRMMRSQLARLPKKMVPAEYLKELEPWRSRFERELGVALPDRVWVWLSETRWNSKLEAQLVRVLDQWGQMRVADHLRASLGDDGGDIVVRSVEVARTGTGEEFRMNVGEAHDLNKRSEFEEVAGRILTHLPREDVRMALRLLGPFLTPNMQVNEVETESRQLQARNRVPPVRISVRKNQLVAKEGTLLTGSQRLILDKMEELHYARRSWGLVAACALMLTTLIIVFFSYLRRFTLNRVRVESKDILCMGVVTLVVVALSKLTLGLAELGLLTRIGHVLPETTLVYLMPIAAGPMLVGMLMASGEILWLFTIFLASALGVMVDMNFSFILVAIVSGISGARGVFKCKKRSDVYWAGLRAGAVSAFVIVLVSALQTQTYDDFLFHAGFGAVAGMLSGVLSSLITMMLVPLIENIFNYTTDVKLLELSNLNHPLLKELIVRAPGTYHHCLVVGSMVEAAAEEIGANPLLSKVMAYYHDIGKMEHAHYFVENQRPGHNPHDHISPHMSRHILVAHVKDGAEMAIRHKLGKPILDGILQHHGTTLISFFYNKAQETQDESLHEVKEEDFRYPGPKPQFREAALCMLADSIEAASRSLDEPTSARLQNIVKNIIQRKFLDGQLDECNLTLRDLSIIEASFCRVLLGIYHSRIDYPKAAGGGASEAVPALRAVPSSNER